MIFLYVAIIILVATAIILTFVSINKKDEKKKNEKLTSLPKNQTDVSEKVLSTSIIGLEKSAEKEENKEAEKKEVEKVSHSTTTDIDVVRDEDFEDFSLDEPKIEKTEKETPVKNPFFNKRRFSFDDEDDIRGVDRDVDSEDEKEISIEKYKKMLDEERRRMNINRPKFDRDFEFDERPVRFGKSNFSKDGTDDFQNPVFDKNATMKDEEED